MDVIKENNSIRIHQNLYSLYINTNYYILYNRIITYTASFNYKFTVYVLTSFITNEIEKSIIYIFHKNSLFKRTRRKLISRANISGFLCTGNKTVQRIVTSTMTIMYMPWIGWKTFCIVSDLLTNHLCWCGHGCRGPVRKDRELKQTNFSRILVSNPGLHTPSTESTIPIVAKFWLPSPFWRACTFSFASL